MENSVNQEYYLDVVKEGESPVWPRDESELEIGQNDIGSGLIQYWAYPKEGDIRIGEIPPAEKAAQDVSTNKAVILIDELNDKSGEELLELIIVNNKHALAHTYSNLANLEDNISSMLDFAKNKLDLVIEHFMTTENVSLKVEHKLDSLEDKVEGEENEVSETKSEQVNKQDDGEIAPDEEESWGMNSLPALKNRVSSSCPETIRQVAPSGLSINNPFPGSYKPQSQVQSQAVNPAKRGLRFWLIVLLPVILVLGMFAFAILNKDKILAKIQNQGNKQEAKVVEVVPTPTPTPTPITVDRSGYKIRVLNGTKKTGAAATLSTTLKEKGWDVIKTGNNSRQDIEQTQINTKKGLDDLATVLSGDLSSDYQATASASLKDSDSVDAEVIIGSK